MFNKFRSIVLAMLFSICCMPLYAAQVSPVSFLKNTTDKMITTLNANKSRLDKNSSYINVLIERELLPKVDFVEMAKWVVGRRAWLAATQSDRIDFVNAFKKLVVQTYATTLNNYNDQTIVYQPLRTQYQGKKRVQVNSTIYEPANGGIRVSYRLVNRQGHWKVYDIIIEGVSLIKGFQAQFADDIAGHGLPFTTKKIFSHLNT